MQYEFLKLSQQVADVLQDLCIVLKLLAAYCLSFFTNAKMLKS
jgi:hypothetical protein